MSQFPSQPPSQFPHNSNSNTIPVNQVLPSQQPAPLQEWQNKMGCFSPNPVTQEVMGISHNFYPVSLGLLFKLRNIARPLARSLAILFGKTDQDTGTRSVTMQRESSTADRPMLDQETTIEPLSEGMARMRTHQRIEAIEGIIDSLTDPINQGVIGEIVMDSLRDIFPKDRTYPIPPQEFMAAIPAPAITNLLIGVSKANKGLFGPLADSITDILQNSVDRVKQARTQATTIG